MCGIAGYISKKEKLLPEVLTTMLNTMIARGPDGDGTYIENNILLGMRRLSIIDLDHGWQPFFANHRQIIVFQNGEIYNYRLLRNELQKLGYKFNSKSDTEVLAHGYHAWGLSDLLSKVDGMFAMVIYDKTQNKIYFARDPFGEKPFYYYHDQDKFLYSSNTFAINKILGNYSLNDEAVKEYVLTHFISGEKSIFQGIKKLLPGHFLEIELSQFSLKSQSYYQLKSKKNHNADVTSLENLLSSSIEKRMIADVPVGIFLSGGLDSSLIAILASKLTNSPLKTFSMGFHDDKCDESHYSKYVANLIGSEHHHFYFDANSFRELLPKVVKALDEPLGDQAILPTYWLAQESRQHIKVVMSGEGADEIFAGYSYYNQFTIDTPNLKWYQKLFSKKVVSLNNMSIDYGSNQLGSGFPLVASLDDLEQLFTSKNTVNFKENCYYEAKNLTRLQFAQAIDMQTWLANDLLVKLDRMTLGVSLEGRCPYLAKDLVDFAYNLPDKAKIVNGSGKNILKQLGEKYFPKEFIYRKKQGFVLPMEAWINDWVKNINFMEYFMPLAQVEMNVDYIKQLYEDKGRVRLQFSLLILNEWLKNYDKTLNGDN